MQNIPHFAVMATAEEWNAVLTVLGNLPTSSGVFPLAMKIKGQVETGIAQLQAAAAEAAAPDAGAETAEVPKSGNRQQRRAADRQAGKPAAPAKAAAAPPKKAATAAPKK